MALCLMLGRHRAELRADFQRYYGLNLDDMGGAYSVEHAADLAACLPSDSAVLRAMYPRNGWTATEYLLHRIEYECRILIWQQSRDGQKGRNKPRPLPTPEDEAKVRRKLDATDRDMVAEMLGIDIGDDKEVPGDVGPGDSLP